MLQLGSSVNIVRCDSYDKLELNAIQHFGESVTLFRESGRIISVDDGVYINRYLGEDDTLSDEQRDAYNSLIDLLKQAKKYDYIFFPNA